MAKQKRKIAVHIPRLMIPGEGRAHIRWEDLMERMVQHPDCIYEKYNPRKPYYFKDHEHLIIDPKYIKEMFPELYDWQTVMDRQEKSPSVG